VARKIKKQKMLKEKEAKEKRIHPKEKTRLSLLNAPVGFDRHEKEGLTSSRRSWTNRAGFKKGD